jgi:hypothetical protein
VPPQLVPAVDRTTQAELFFLEEKYLKKEVPSQKEM